MGGVDWEPGEHSPPAARRLLTSNCVSSSRHNGKLSVARASVAAHTRSSLGSPDSRTAFLRGWRGCRKPRGYLVKQGKRRHLMDRRCGHWPKFRHQARFVGGDRGVTAEQPPQGRCSLDRVDARRLGVSALAVLILAIRHLMTMRKPGHVLSADSLRLNDDPLKAGHGDPLSR
jgi:hypothetical protein